ARLIERGHTPTALILPGPPSVDQPILLSRPVAGLPMAGMPSAIAKANVPTYQIGRLRSRATRDLIRSLTPDLLVVACFPRRISRELTEIAHLAAINLHPSLLPRHRGPDPLFWIMRDGGEGCGVTVHLLADRFDAGAIVAQREVTYPDGVSEVELERLLATVGADLTTDAITALVTGAPPPTPQDERSATYESWPVERDFAVERSWPVQRAYNFIRGVRHRGIPVRINTEDCAYVAVDAIEFGSGQCDPTSPDPGLTSIQFDDGWLVVRLAGVSQT
ncbi:MAG: methionyl-tRNA formyltransferase, partial [Vicinamibacterales bacterium]